jgi:hypothetical protein
LSAENKYFSGRDALRIYRALRWPRHAVAADISLTPPPPIFPDRRAAAAADNLSARRRCHPDYFFFLLYFQFSCQA